MTYRIQAVTDRDGELIEVDCGHDGARLAGFSYACTLASLLASRCPATVTVQVLDSDGYPTYQAKGTRK